MTLSVPPARRLVDAPQRGIDPEYEPFVRNNLSAIL